MLHNANTIYLLISNQYFCSFFSITSLHVSEIPRRYDLTNCAAWHTSSNWEWGNEGKQILRKHKPHVRIHFVGISAALRFAVPPCTHSSVCFSFFSISPFVSLSLFLCLCLLLFLLTFNPLCPFLPLSLFLFYLSQKKKKTLLLPQVEGVFYPYLCFSSCPPLFQREYRHKTSIFGQQLGSAGEQHSFLTRVGQWGCDE